MAHALTSTTAPMVDDPVEVHCSFSRRWVAGFTVAEADATGYRLRRSSDRSLLPAWFAADEVRLTPR